MSQHYDDIAEKMDDLKNKEYAAKEQASLDAFIRRLPTMVVTLQEFKELGEYSASYPTGTTPGKKWRTELNAYDRRFYLGGGKTRWIIRQYDPEAKPYDKDDKSTHGDIKILQFRPVFRVPATSVICVDKEQQHMFLLDQAYFISGLDPYDNSTFNAKDIARTMGYDIPSIRDLYNV